MDFMWYDYLMLIVGIVLAFSSWGMDIPALALLALVLFIGGIAHSKTSSIDNGNRRIEITNSMYGQGYPSPSKVDGGSRTGAWSNGGCRLKFKVKKTNGDWTILVVHSNGSVSVPTPAQVKGLLSNPLCS